METSKKNMKNIGAFFITVLITCCSNSKQAATNTFDQYAAEVQLKDSVLLSLQQQNDLVIACAADNTAWIKSSTYQILAQNKNEWTGYFYYVNNTAGGSAGGSSNFNINPSMVPKAACDSLWQFLQQQQVWKIKGDEGKNFCAAPNNNCNINDGQTWRLLIITKTKMTQSSFYEPEFYEGCCPGNTDRKLFIDAIAKIQKLVSESGGGR